jgi:hypothetical protein
MAYQSHHCSATLLCSACISVSLLVSAALSVLLSDMHLCSLLLLRFISCTLHASTRMNHTQQQPHLFSVLCFYTLCAPSAYFMCNASACSSQRHCSSLQVVHCNSSSLLHSSTTESLHFSVLHAFLTSSHLLIIMETLHLLWRFCSL